MEEQLLTMNEAAVIAQVRATSLYQAASAGRLKTIERFGKMLVNRSDLDAYLLTMGQRNGYKAKTGQQPAKKRRTHASEETLHE